MNIMGQVSLVSLGLVLGVLVAELLPAPTAEPAFSTVQAVAAGGAWAVATEDGTTYVHGSVSWVLPPSERDALVRLLLPSPDGGRLLVADATRIRIVSVQSGILEATHEISQSEGLSEISTAAWSADGRVAIGTVDGRFGVWLTSSENVEWMTRIKDAIDEIFWVDGERTLLITSGGERTAWDARTGEPAPLPDAAAAAIRACPVGHRM